VTSPDRPLPDLEEPLHAPFWQASAAGELRVQECTGCGRLRWPPRTRCARCGSYEVAWQALTPRGRLFSWTVAHHAFGRFWQDRVPYIVGIVCAADAPEIRFLGNVIDAQASELRADQEMEAVFEEVSDPAGGAVTLVNWRPVPS
jgi:uncharacterized protein